MEKSASSNSIRTFVFVAMMGAISTVLMAFEVSIPIAPSFMKFDISDLPALFAGFFLGPAAGSGVVVVKILLKLITRGTNTAFVGELMNIFGSVCFILPASLIYKKNHTKKGAIISMAVATVFVSVVYIFINLYISFPMYSALYGLPLETIIAMGTAINPNITSLPTLMVLSVFPFNLIKHGITSLVTYLIYKRAGNALRKILKEQ